MPTKGKKRSIYLNNRNLEMLKKFAQRNNRSVSASINFILSRAITYDENGNVVIKEMKDADRD